MRIYDTKLIEKMNTIMKFNPNRYQSKNQLLLELLELGVREKLKEFPAPPTPPASMAKAAPSPQSCNCNAEILKQIKELIESMHSYNKQNVEGLLAHLKMSERLSSSIYNMVFAILKDEPVTAVQVELGYLDDVPKRFTEFLAMLLDDLANEVKREDDEGKKDDKSCKAEKLVS